MVLPNVSGVRACIALVYVDCGLSEGRIISTNRGSSLGMCLSSGGLGPSFRFRFFGVTDKSLKRCRLVDLVLGVFALERDNGEGLGGRSLADVGIGGKFLSLEEDKIIERDVRRGGKKGL